MQNSCQHTGNLSLALELSVFFLLKCFHCVIGWIHRRGTLRHYFWATTKVTGWLDKWHCETGVRDDSTVLGLRKWKTMELPFSEMKKTAGRAGIRENIQGFIFGQVWDAYGRIQHLLWYTVEYSNELKRRSWPRDRNYTKLTCVWYLSHETE